MPTTAPGATGSDPLEQARIAAGELARRTGAERHDALVVLGTGLGGVAEALGGTETPVDLANLPWFPRFGGHGHRSLAWSVDIHGHRVLVSAGRLHLYEGLGAIEVAHTVRVAAAAGVKTAVLTCAVGGIGEGMDVGAIALVTDHLNLTATSPLVGIPTESHWPSPFVDLVDTWSPRLRALARRVDPALVDGVYAQVTGPNFETPAEIRMLRGAGADVVGMSIALEAIAARHVGVEVLGLAVVTNRAAGLSPEPITVAEVVEVTTSATERIARLVEGVLEQIEAPEPSGV
jgi:purine-nucleoside phosphorylase